MIGPNEGFDFDDFDYDNDADTSDNWDGNQDLWDMYGVDNQEDFDDAYENDDRD